jgi:hypothetical protein
VLTPSQKGSIAEAAIIAAAVKLGIGVSKPVNEGLRYDLVFDFGRLMRVQCKWAMRMDDVVYVRSYSCRRTRDGLQRRVYAEGEIDAIAAYCADLDRCYFIPFERLATQAVIQLRLAPTKNNQHARVHWANEYEFAATLGAGQGP